MAKLHYTFNYNSHEAEASFKVDTEKFTPEMANATLEFFTWNYDKDENPIDEVLKKYALKAIEFATYNNHNVFGVKCDFITAEGFCLVDGTQGIELITVEGYEFYEGSFEITKVCL